jgi:hypothetical protein
VLRPYAGALRIDEEAAGREVCLKVGNAALALAGESGGIALDVLGFIINSADDLLPRSRSPARSPGPARMSAGRPTVD